MRTKRISITRRIVQVISIILLVYGGYLFKTKQGTDAQTKFFPALSAPQGATSTASFKKGSILWPSGDTPVLENYPPGLVCRFNPNGGMFKACIVHFFSENLTWRTHIKYLLPHITLFVLLCFLLGRMWCGWVCPIGSVGDFLTALRRRMNLSLKRFPNGFHRGLRISSYGLLGISCAISAFIGIPSFARYQCYFFLPYCQVCPARLICPMFGFIKPNWKDFSVLVSSVFTILAWVVLGLFVAAFFFGRRVWCHLCPVGLINSWFNWGCGVELRKNSIKCIKCGSCADACPMGLTRMYKTDRNEIYTESGCIMCMRCVEVCPRKGCLSVHFFKKKITQSHF